MRIRSAMARHEVGDLHKIFDKRDHLRNRGYALALELAELLDCHIDEAEDILNRCDNAHEFLRVSPIEIYDDGEPETIPIREQFGIDRETWWLWSFMAGGFALVLLAVYAAWG